MDEDGEIHILSVLVFHDDAAVEAFIEIEAVR